MDTAYCTADCTEAALPAEGVTVIGNFLHAHTVGTAMTLRHIRNGVELEPIDVNEHYDFNFQQITFVSFTLFDWLTLHLIAMMHYLISTD